MDHQDTSRIIDNMLTKATQAMNNAYASYSHFKVGACVRTPEGHLFSGCNVENTCFSVIQCAEATALGNMVTAGFQKVSEVLIISSSPVFCPPCGACRQRIVEFADPDTRIYMCNAAGEKEVKTIGELLPLHFSNKTWKNV